MSENTKLHNVSGPVKRTGEKVQPVFDKVGTPERLINVPLQGRPNSQDEQVGKEWNPQGGEFYLGSQLFDEEGESRVEFIHSSPTPPLDEFVQALGGLEAFASATPAGAAQSLIRALGSVSARDTPPESVSE